MIRFYYILCVLMVLGASSKAQNLVCLPLKHGDGFIAFANIDSPVKGNSPQRFGFIKNQVKTLFNFTWDARDTLSDLSKIKLKGSILKVEMDNDSTLVFSLNEDSQIMKYLSSSYLNFDVDVTDDQIANFKSHKLIAVYLITGTRKRYNLFIFNDQNKIDIQNMAMCFLSNVNKKPN